ncbi:MAG: acetyl-CoA carboxylase biotin carboxylase subunit [Hellea sp.]|nr:acetyl-CoA carboxylase biotin carboxylase subunit [Hellea sp.]
MTTIKTILIANRGEIACRVMRTAKKMRIRTIAVYSNADANAVHTKMADDAVHIGASAVNESYLVIDKIIDAAKQSGADAIHPGYGFLSENADFAKACDKAGIIFIGPNTLAIDVMGDKAKSKRRMIKAGVPCVPGYQGEKQDDKTLIAEAAKIGFPVMVKAAAGGGGRGMRFVDDAKSLPDAITDARSEALGAFGSDILIIEKAVQKPRHVEIQVFADKSGNTIHLGERDCSVQRRHQKVLEEAPCPVMTLELREAMGTAAVKAAKDIGYVGAGTVEFMLDSSGAFYFLEMNTRLQVEHPVTELVTGLDLVELQIRVAQGEDLPITQDDIAITGHAIEARLYAEDPANDFLPATGRAELFLPTCGDSIRVDSGIETGSDISPFYDPMIAKIMAFGSTREEARAKLVNALNETAIFGVKTNRSFLINALEKEAFAKGEATTAFISENFDEASLAETELNSSNAAVAAVLQYEAARDASLTTALDMPCNLLGWSSASRIATPYQFGDMRVEVTPRSGQDYDIAIGEETLSVKVINRTNNAAELLVNDKRSPVHYLAKGAHIHLSSDGLNFDLTNDNEIYSSIADEGGAGIITAPMHGAVIDVFVKEGETVTAGQRLAILEAMKMQHEILADIDGAIASVNIAKDTQIAADALMFEIEESE